MRNFARINNYYNRIEAIGDWQRMADRAEAEGRADLVEKFMPPQTAGHRTIDKCIAKLRTALEDADSTKR